MLFVQSFKSFCEGAVKVYVNLPVIIVNELGLIDDVPTAIPFNDIDPITEFLSYKKKLLRRKSNNLTRSLESKVPRRLESQTRKCNSVEKLVLKNRN